MIGSVMKGALCACLTLVGRGLPACRNLAVALCLATPVAADEITIAALGDSLTQGYGLSPADGFVPQLERWLHDQGADVSIINAGVSGDTTAGGRSRIAWTLTDEVEALIVALGGNDVLRGIDPAVSRANLDEILKVAGERNVPVLLAGISAPGNFGPDYKRQFEAIYPDLAAQYEVLFYPDFLHVISKIGLEPANIRQFMQQDGIHPNSEGVSRIVADIGPSVLELVARAR
ncbi:MAG: arylesterase [Paracoccaceae bacterium]